MTNYVCKSLMWHVGSGTFGFFSWFLIFRLVVLCYNSFTPENFTYYAYLFPHYAQYLNVSRRLRCASKDSVSVPIDVLLGLLKLGHVSQDIDTFIADCVCDLHARGHQGRVIPDMAFNGPHINSFSNSSNIYDKYINWNSPMLHIVSKTVAKQWKWKLGPCLTLWKPPPLTYSSWQLHQI